MFDGYWREAVERAVDPVGEGLNKVGITANTLTVVGIAGSTAAAIAIGSGSLRLGLVLLLLGAVPDLLDGAVAKAAGPTSRRGAFFDSTADRVSDTVVLCGIVWYYVAEERGFMIMVPVIVMAVSWLVSYQRAKAESLGFTAKGGVMERAERVIALCVGLLFPDVLDAVLWIMLALTAITAMQRFAKIWGQATDQLEGDIDAAGEV